MYLPPKFLTRCALACAGMFSVYLMFMIATVYFASYQTELSREKRIREAEVIALETKYYAAIDVLSESNPASLGYVTPSRVDYVAALGTPTITRADR